MPLQYTFTERFQRNYKKLSAEEQKQIKKTIELLTKNPGHPSLRTKHIEGTDKLFESSGNMDIRVVWHYEKGMMITLSDVGHHDILKQY